MTENDVTRRPWRTRVWFWKPQWYWHGWKTLIPFFTGGDEFDWHTVCIGWTITGRVIIATRRCPRTGKCADVGPLAQWPIDGYGLDWSKGRPTLADYEALDQITCEDIGCVNGMTIQGRKYSEDGSAEDQWAPCGQRADTCVIPPERDQAVSSDLLCWVCCSRTAWLTDVLNMDWCQECWDQADEDAARIFRAGTWE